MRRSESLSLIKRIKLIEIGKKIKNNLVPMLNLALVNSPRITKKVTASSITFCYFHEKNGRKYNSYQFNNSNSNPSPTDDIQTTIQSGKYLRVARCSPVVNCSAVDGHRVGVYTMESTAF